MFVGEFESFNETIYLSRLFTSSCEKGKKKSSYAFSKGTNTKWNTYNFKRNLNLVSIFLDDNYHKT